MPRAAVFREPTQRRRYKVNDALVSEIKAIIDEKPYYGLRRIHWQLNRDREARVNIKAVHTILKIKGWLMKKRPRGLRSRVEGWASKTSKPDVR